MSIDAERDLTPQKLKEKLDLYVIGQEKVKRMISNALRNRYRKRVLLDKIKFSNQSNEEVKEHNKDIYDLIRSHHILIEGKSGSGKTEIIRQTAKICNSPYIKVDAVRYTEVGYLGDDVENIISDLYKKTKIEFENSMQAIFWEIDSVKVAWECFILTYLLGSNYQKHILFNQYRDMLHNREFEALEINVWFNDMDKVEKFIIKDLRDYFWNLTKYRLQDHVSNMIKCRWTSIS